MTSKWTLLGSYRKLTFWSKVGFWGSVTSIVALLLEVLASAGSAAFITVITQPVPVLCLTVMVIATLCFRWRSRRLDALLQRLKDVPEAERTTLTRLEYGKIL